MRSLNAGAQALLARAVAGEDIGVAQLVEIGLAVPQYYTTAGFPLVWGGQTWLGDSMQLAQVSHEMGALPGLEITLPAVTEAQMTIALGDATEGAAVTVRECLVDPNTGEVPDAMLVWRGRVNTRRMSYGGNAIIVLSCEHRGARALRTKPSRYTNDEQQRLHPGDASLDFDPKTDGARLVWPAASYYFQR